MDNNTKVFFALLQSGLWENEPSFSCYWPLPESVEWQKLYQLASQQSVLGLVLAGYEKLKNLNVQRIEDIPKPVLMSWIGEIQMLEQRNLSMNHYIRVLIEQLRKVGIEALLVKGQGIAQCYEKPLWRSSGDIDLLLDGDNYEKAKALLIPLSDDVETEYSSFKHQGIILGGWSVELHGTLHTRLSRKMDSTIDRIQEHMVRHRRFREWHNEDMDVLLPSPDDDVVFIFTHILHHFFIDGIGLRQICDLSRLLWVYKDTLDYELLQSRIKAIGLTSEWKAFAAFAVNYLGLPSVAMPLYSPEQKWIRKADNILVFVLESGNFGHNRKLSREGKLNSAWRKIGVFIRHLRVFPVDSIKFLLYFFVDGLRVARDKKETGNK